MKEADFHELVHSQASFISDHQLTSGAIPWYRGGIVDPWDHVESAIALDLCHRFDEAARAYMWLQDIQNPDGSWWSGYLDGQPQDLTKDTNFSSYIASGAYYHYMVTGDLDFLRRIWPTVEKGIAFALRLQQPTGEIYWARDANDAVWKGALMAASSCTWLSIKCGMEIARTLSLDRPDWDMASRRLAGAIRGHPELFDKFGEDNQGFATTWYYPVLAGVVQGQRAKEHILEQWADFVIEDRGCKCVCGTPWVTVAETCELILALTNIGEEDRARLLLDWTLRLRDPAGGFGSGIKLPDELIWPVENNTWTSAAVIMAVSALDNTEDVSATDFRRLISGRF